MEYLVKKMKKLLSINLIILVLFLCSCGQTTQTETSESLTSSISKNTTSISVENIEYSTSKSIVSETTTNKSKNDNTTVKTVTTKSPTQKEITTTKKSTTTATTKKETKSINCTVEISCKTIKKNIRNFKLEKKEFVPKNYVILSQKTITVPEGSSAFDAIKKACKENKCDEKCKFCDSMGYIHLDFVYTPGFESDYIRGIHQLYEKDCGTRSGWMYSVNDVFPNYGCNKYELKNNDTIKVLYTCELGDDLK